MHYKAWTAYFLQECESWFAALEAGSQNAILTDIGVLREIGPQLGRPQVDTLKDSKHDNMKELRTRYGRHHYRIAFAFDPKRQAVLLLGGDKTGKDQVRFYQDLIRRADAIYDRHLAGLGKGR
jgi:hypothetical protein